MITNKTALQTLQDLGFKYKTTDELFKDATWVEFASYDPLYSGRIGYISIKEEVGIEFRVSWNDKIIEITSWNGKEIKILYKDKRFI